MGVPRCGVDMFYDKPTKSCTYCSVICDDMDIQETRAQCEGKCPDYLTSTMTTSETTTIATSTTTPLTNVINNDTVIAICVLLAVLILIVLLFALHHYRQTLVNLTKKRESGKEVYEPQIHAQETRQDSERPEMHELLPVGDVAFADMPDHT